MHSPGAQRILQFSCLDFVVAFRLQGTQTRERPYSSRFIQAQRKPRCPTCRLLQTQKKLAPISDLDYCKALTRGVKKSICDPEDVFHKSNNSSTFTYFLFIIMTTMKAWQSTTFLGPIERNLYLSSSVQRPIPSKTEVIVEVVSTSVNPIDYKILELGIIPKLVLRSPVTPGLDISGRVVEIGSEVNHFKPGDIVFGSCNGVFDHGALAQFVQVSQDTLAMAPPAVKSEDLAAIATVGMTTLQGLRPYIRPGDKIFINGGSGGTGTAAIQIAKALGCHVTTSCSTANVDLCRSLGADEVLDYKQADIIEQLNARETRFEAIIDNVGTPSILYRAAHRYLQPSGIFVQVGLGMNLAALRQFLANKLLPSFLGGGKGKYVFAITKPNRSDFEQLAAWMEMGKVRSVIDSVHEFNAAPEAFARLKTGRARGKVVVCVKTADGLQA